MDYGEPQVPTPQLTEEQVRSAQQKKLELFKKNGYPMPTAPVVPSGNPLILNKIQQIKMGLKKNEFADIIHKEVQDPTLPLPVPLNKNRQQQKQRPGMPPQKAAGPPPPDLFSAAPMVSNELMEVERLLGMDNPSPAARPQAYGQPGLIGAGNRLPEMPQASDEEGIYAAQEVKSKFYSTLQEKQARMQQPPAYMPENTAPQYYPQQGMAPQQPYVQPYPYQAPMLPAGMVMVNEEDLKKKIINISTQVAKKISEQMIKSVLSEYLKQSKNTIVESEKIKKAEVVGENVVKIDGKVYKLVPATLKVKEE